ncbi:MAG: 4Fe-4S binding protein [Micromonosporaceae bacterium]|nr:4Fe-4S binding protein [Micromonosporaceae bacterium]
MSDRRREPSAPGQAIRIVVASGKGGTGKTTVATSLAVVLADRGGPVAYVDCDAEEPNGHLFLKPTIHRRSAVTSMIPEIDLDRCRHCGACATACRAGAILVTPDTVLTFPSLCNGCGGCALACPHQAIREIPRTIGTVSEGMVDRGAAGTLAFCQGETEVGQSMTPEVIRSAITAAPAAHTLIMDAPPGTTCPAVEAMRTADVALLVTEPTPFGLNDLRLAVEVARRLGLPFAVAINRAGTGDSAVADYCAAEGIPVLLEVPDDRRIAERYSRGEVIVDGDAQLRPAYTRLATGLRELAGQERVKATGSTASDPVPDPLLDDRSTSRPAAASGAPGPDGPLELVVVSGKGGTGKTSITASFLALAARDHPDGVIAVDCDADAANLHLVLEPEVRERWLFSGGATAVVDQATCIECGICTDYCRFDAIGPDEDVAGGNGYVVDPTACEGCGVCADMCPVQAVELVTLPQGEWFVSETRIGPLVHARLAPGRKNSGKLVSQVREEAQAVAQAMSRDLAVEDGSPGLGCAVIASLTGARAALIVTEPTCAGLHDLRRVASLVKQLNVRAAVCVNKADLNPELASRLEVEAVSLGLPVLGRVRYDEAVTLAQLMRTSVVELGDSPAARDINRLWRRTVEFLTGSETTASQCCPSVQEET